MNENKHLSVILSDLSHSIIDEVVSAKQDGMLEIFKDTYIKQNVTSFDYDKGITGYSTTQELLIKEKCRWKDELEFDKKQRNSNRFKKRLKKSSKYIN